MGILANTVRNLFVPQIKEAIAATVPVWDQGKPQMPQWDYERGAREGYMLSDLVYACINERISSAGEPPLCAYGADDEKVDSTHPALHLLEHPNPHMGRSRFWSQVVLYLDIGGNAYIEKVRAGSGKPVELWLLRPDRVRVVPDARTFIGGYTYTVGSNTKFLPAEDVIHIKTTHPIDDYYGLAPMMAIAGRVDSEIRQREFCEAFFRNAGVPAGLLTFQRALTEDERTGIRQRFRDLYGGPNSWRLMPLDGNDVKYIPMGLPPGASQMDLPGLTRLAEARILGAFGVPASLVPTLLGMEGNRGQTASVSDREDFWQNTLVPLFRDMDSMLTLGLTIDFPDLERIEHDLGKVKALQEDEDKRHGRVREDYKAGLITFREARLKLGEPEEPDEAGIVLVPTNMVPTWSDEMLTEPEPPPEPQPMLAPGQQPALPNGQQPPNGQAQPPVAANGRTNGSAR